jgi:hypothetical protein
MEAALLLVLGGVLGGAAGLPSGGRWWLRALLAAALATAAVTGVLVWIQYARGDWPITDEFTRAHYGGTAMAVRRTAVFLGGLIGVPCLLAAAAVRGARRRPR